MKLRFSNMLKHVTFNFKTLLLFEVFYRILGVVVFFPLSRFLFSLSVRVMGESYITNRMLFDYITRPSTIGFLFVLLVVLSVYLVIEMIYLSLLFEYGYQKEKITLRELLPAGLSKVRGVLKRYHALMVLPAFLFFIVVELLQFAGVAATVALPQYFLDNLDALPYLRYVFYGFLVLLFVLFVETAFILHQFVLEKNPLKTAIRKHRNILKRNRLRFVLDFGVLNVLLNLALYGFYMLLVLLLAAIVFLTFGQQLVLGIVLTVLYAVYVVVGIVATFVLIPINYALIYTWYKRSHPEKQTLPEKKQWFSYQMSPLKKLWLKRAFALFAFVALIVNFFSVYSVVAADRSSLEYWHHPDIIAHRGASMDAPENTLAALEKAIEQRSDYVEIDVHLSADDVPVLMHDFTVGRTTNAVRNFRVDELTFEQLRGLDAGSWFSEEFEGERVPSLREAIELVDGRAKMLIELKPSGDKIVEETLELMEAYDLYDDAKIMSFDPDHLRRVKEENPDVETVMLVTRVFGSTTALIGNDNYDHFAIEATYLMENQNLLDRIHRRDKLVYVWTVNSESRLETLTELGVDGIITDVPVLAREVAYRKNTSTMMDEILRYLFAR